MLNCKSDLIGLYVRPMEYYLGLEKKKDFINWELDETLDINGWDLSKALQHFHKSNATLFEWANSPIIYDTTDEWKKVMQTADPYFSCESAMYHYYGTANKNYHENLTEDMVKYKKYFYVLRPILACKWIEERKCPPPVWFQNMVDTVLEEPLKPQVARLLEKKKSMVESQKGPRVDEINAYIENKLAYYRKLVDSMEDDKNADWGSLNELFVALLKEKCNLEQRKE